MYFNVICTVFLVLMVMADEKQTQIVAWQINLHYLKFKILTSQQRTKNAITCITSQLSWLAFYTSSWCNTSWMQKIYIQNQSQVRTVGENCLKSPTPRHFNVFQAVLSSEFIRFTVLNDASPKILLHHRLSDLYEGLIKYGITK